MAYCYDKAVLSKLRHAQSQSRIPEIVIENLPSSSEVIQYLDELSQYSTIPLHENFYFNHRDGTVAIRHRIPEQNIGNSIPDSSYLTPEHYLHFDECRQKRVPVFIELFTVTQDYTRRSNRVPCLSDQWKIEEQPQRKDGTYFVDVGFKHDLSASTLIDLVAPCFSRLQTRILVRKESYLHIIRVDKVHLENWTEGRTEAIVYTLEVAHRHKKGAEPVKMRNASSIVRQWSRGNNYERVIAPDEEITLWAIQDLTPTSEVWDYDRLLIISNAINSEINIRDKNSSDEPVMVEGGNRIELLRARHAFYMDGRARFPLIRSAVKDMSTLKRNHCHPPKVYRSEELIYGKELKYQKLNDSGIVKKIILVAILTCICSVIVALVYFFCRQNYLQDGEVESLNATVVSLFFSVVQTFFIVWVFIIFRTTSVNDHLKMIEKNGKELFDEATKIETTPPDRNGKLKVEAVCSKAGREWWDGSGLSFVSKFDFTGYNRCPKEYTFTVKDLIEAGYETSFARDGRELLIAPGGESVGVWTVELDDENRVLFQKLSPAEVRGENGKLKMVVRKTRGVWCDWPEISHF